MTGVRLIDKSMRTFTFGGLVALTFSLSFLSASAQTTCGTITGPADIFDINSPIAPRPITNCDNPFDTTEPLDNLSLNTVTVQANDTIIIPPSGAVQYSLSDDRSFWRSSNLQLYRHTGDSYEFVETAYPEPTTAELVQIAQEYLQNPALAPSFAEIIETGNDSSLFDSEGYDIVDEVTGRTLGELFDGFRFYLEYSHTWDRPPLLPGTYTAVLAEYIAVQTLRQTPAEHFFSLFIPTAYAQASEFPHFVKTVTFTLAPETPEPVGASSVLFLPGIQASRLYLGDGQQVFNRLWEPSNNTDVSALGLSETGTSIVDIRTNDVVDETSVDLIGKNIYKGFISFMDELVDEGAIKDWTPFAYDWRYDVFEVVENGTKYLDGLVRNPVDEIIRLADDSPSEKVTIVAHSNGGLLAKAIMLELERRGQSELVDKIVFIGTPQLGTPKAIGTVLHGYDQEALGGLIIDDGVAREIIRNLPGAYSLLPSEKYFEVTNDAVISFDNSSTTAGLRTGYGSSISSIASLNAFMVGLADTTGRDEITPNEVNRPITVNETMYFEAQAKHKLKLDNWVPPAGVEVFQVAGTGLPTMQAVEYREIKEWICPPNAVSLLQCRTEALLKPHAKFTVYGDETVVSDSASYAWGEAERFFLNLNEIENDRFPFIGTKITHANLTEISQLQELLWQVFETGSSSNVEYLSTNEPRFSESYDIEEMNSPVQISTRDSQGRVTGMVREGGTWVRKEEIPDSAYLEFGGTKYLITPSDVRRTTKLVGESIGGYTLTLSTLDQDGVQKRRHEVVNATTTSTMVAEYSKQNDEYSTIKTDYGGDGVFEYESTVDGVPVLPPVPQYTYATLKNSINLLTIKKSLKDVLLSLAIEAEKLDAKSNKKIFARLEKVTLRILEETVIVYQKKRILSSTQADELLKIIRFLSK
jgi:pimeloyl-ACP methyl ester carboxylesterase